jgi:hypothetical protein
MMERSSPSRGLPHLDVYDSSFHFLDARDPMMEDFLPIPRRSKPIGFGVS